MYFYCPDLYQKSYKIDEISNVKSKVQKCLIEEKKLFITFRIVGSNTERYLSKIYQQKYFGESVEQELTYLSQDNSNFINLKDYQLTFTIQYTVILIDNHLHLYIHCK